MPTPPQDRDRHGLDIKVGAYTCLSPQSLEGRKSVSQLEDRSVISSDLRRKRYLEYEAMDKEKGDQFFEEMLVLCDEVFYPLRDRFLVKLWKRPFREYYKVDGIRGIITIDIPITRFKTGFRYSRIVIIPRGFILDSKELKALWMAAFSIPKPIDGSLDSITIAVFTLKAGEKLPTYHFERLKGRSKIEFMTFVGLPATNMAKFLESLIPFFEEKLKGFLERFEIPLSYVGYQLGYRGSYIRTKRPKPDLRSFSKYRPSVVDYLDNVKSGWLKSALKGLMMLINELVDAYIYKIKPQKVSELKIYYAVRKEAKALRNHRLKPKPIEKRIKRWTEIALLQQSIHLGEGSPLGNLLKSSKPPSYHRRPNLAASEAARG